MIKTEDLVGIEETLKTIDDKLANRQYGGALDLAYKGVKLYPDNEELNTQLADLLLTCKEYDKALIRYRIIHDEIQKSGKKTDISIIVAIITCLVRLKRYAEATKLVEELIEKAPTHAPTLILLATCRRQSEQLEEAIELIDKALMLDPENCLAIHEKAEIHLVKKEIEPALLLLEKNIRRSDVYGSSIDLWLQTLHAENRNRYAQDTLEELMNCTKRLANLVFLYI